MKPRNPELRPLCKRHAHRGGFTLIECLGAFAVLSGTLVVLLLALGMLRQSERSFNQRQEPGWNRQPTCSPRPLWFLMPN